MQVKNRFIYWMCNAVCWFVVLGCFAGCGGDNGGGEEVDPRKPDLGSIVGIDFYEVRRSFDNGLAYDTIGFVQEPEWHVKFTHADSVQIYVPGSDSSFNFAITHDHDSFFHFARESWKVVDMHPDSIMLQRLSLRHLTVDKVTSNVYMRFYSGAYIRNKLHTPVAELRKPRRVDSLFVRKLVEKANRNPDNPDSAYASKYHAQLISNSPILKIKRQEVDSVEQMGRSKAYSYLYPEYDIEISKAYKDFYHTFSVVVDEHGKLHLGDFFVMPEFEESRRKVLTGIVEVYLQHLLDITPATTLGWPHASVVYLRVRGRTDAADETKSNANRSVMKQEGDIS